MFTGLDSETIKSVLYMNSILNLLNFLIAILWKKGGRLDATIETLLRICDEN